MGVSLILDILINYAFRDKIISVFYILGASYFWISHSLITYWSYAATYDSNQLFNTFWLLTSFLTFFLVTV